MPAKSITPFLFLLLILAAPYLPGQELIEQDLTRWALINPQVSGIPQYAFAVSPTLITWHAVPGGDWTLQAGAETTVVIPPNLAGAPLLLDLQAYGGLTGVATVHFSLGSGIAYTERQDGPFVHQQVINLPAGNHTLRITANGSNIPLDSNALTRASLTPIAVPYCYWRIPADVNHGPWHDLTIVGPTNATVFLFLSGPTLPGGITFPGILGTLWLAQPTLALIAFLPPSGQWSMNLSMPTLNAIKAGLSNPCHLQVLSFQSASMRIGSLTTLVAR